VHFKLALSPIPPANWLSELPSHVLKVRTTFNAADKSSLIPDLGAELVCQLASADERSLVVFRLDNSHRRDLSVRTQFIGSIKARMVNLCLSIGHFVLSYGLRNVSHITGGKTGPLDKNSRA
jgi:hypothetical protein